MHYLRSPAACMMASTGSTGLLPQVISTSSHPALSNSSCASSVRSFWQASSTSASFFRQSVRSLFFAASHVEAASLISSAPRPVFSPQQCRCGQQHRNCFLVVFHSSSYKFIARKKTAGRQAVSASRIPAHLQGATHRKGTLPPALGKEGRCRSYPHRRKNRTGH